MKKTNVLILILIIFTASCEKDEEKLIFTDFSKSKIISLKPNKGYPYVMMNVWVNGYVNDSILIKLRSDKNEPILKLKGTIDERWYTDYYGEGPIKLIFDPYKATEGEFEIYFNL